MDTIILAVLSGSAVLLAGSLPWGVLASANQRFGTTAPCAVPLMALYIWIYWRVIGGSWGPRGSEATLRGNLRANRVSGGVWVPALLAGLLGFATLLALLTVMARLVSLPASAPITMPAGMPFMTSFLLLVMASIVAGVTEEAAFRGYMQGPIERRFGLAVAILVNGTMFGLLHFPNHPGDVLTMLPYYIAVSAVYGGLTWAVNSILPALVLHSAGDVWSLGRLWLEGRPEWQLSSSPPAPIRETGVDAGFMAAAAAFLALAGLTAWAYAGVRRLHARRELWEDHVATLP